MALMFYNKSLKCCLQYWNNGTAIYIMINIRLSRSDIWNASISFLYCPVLHLVRFDFVTSQVLRLFQANAFAWFLSKFRLSLHYFISSWFLVYKHCNNVGYGQEVIYCGRRWNYMQVQQFLDVRGWDTLGNHCCDKTQNQLNLAVNSKICGA